MPYKDREAKRRHAREWVRTRRAAWFADKRCAHCGSTERLELDHIDPTQKVSHRIWTWSRSRLAAETVKCQVLCENCHKVKTYGVPAASRPHGTLGRYKEGRCRCVACRKANADYEALHRDYRILPTLRQPSQVALRGPQKG